MTSKKEDYRILPSQDDCPIVNINVPIYRSPREGVKVTSVSTKTQIRYKKDADCQGNPHYKVIRSWSANVDKNKQNMKCPPLNNYYESFNKSSSFEPSFENVERATPLKDEVPPPTIDKLLEIELEKRGLSSKRDSTSPKPNIERAEKVLAQRSRIDYEPLLEISDVPLSQELSDPESINRTLSSVSKNENESGKIYRFIALEKKLEFITEKAPFEIVNPPNVSKRLRAVEEITPECVGSRYFTGINRVIPHPLKDLRDFGITKQSPKRIETKLRTTMISELVEPADVGQESFKSFINSHDIDEEISIDFTKLSDEQIKKNDPKILRVADVITVAQIKKVCREEFYNRP